MTTQKFRSNQLEELITCTLCLDHLKDPRILPCSHTFCYQCIRQFVKDGQFNCPLQDNQTVDQNDIDQLPINRTAKDIGDLVASITSSTNENSRHLCENCSEAEAVNWCDQCLVHYCESCTKSIHSNKALQSHVITLSSEKTNSFCLEHPDEKLKFWCTQCDALVCRDCLLFKHKDHEFLSTKDAAVKATVKLEAAMKQMNDVKQNLRQVAQTTKWIMQQQMEMVEREQQTIQQTFADLQRMLEERRCQLIKASDERQAEAMETLIQRQNSIAEHLNLVTAQELCIEKTLVSTNPIQILQLATALSQNSQQVFDQSQTIDDSCMTPKHLFKRDASMLNYLADIISKLGSSQSNTCGINANENTAKRRPLDISMPGEESQLTPKNVNWPRGYTFRLKKALKLRAIHIHSDYNGPHLAFVVGADGIVMHTAVVSSNDTTLKWITVPLQCDIENMSSVLVWAELGNGSYTYKSRNNPIRAINADYSVTSTAVQSTARIRKGSRQTVCDNVYSIDMVLDIEN
jgi:tripartite motif-containing protein 56